MSKIILLFSLLIFAAQLTFGQCESFTFSVSTYNPTCPDFSDGSISITVSGQTGEVNGEITNSGGSLVLNPNLTGTSPNNLAEGWYYIYLYDEAGCEIYDSVYLADPDEMEIILNVTLPTSISACDGIAEVDTVLFHNGNFFNLGFYWTGGPGGIGETIKSDLCYGTYSITVNNEVGCGLTKDFTVGNLSVSEAELITNYQLFPNPFSESTTLIIESKYVGETMRISNQLGEVVKTIQINTESTMLNSENLPAGVYFFTVSDIKGKFIIQ